MSCVVYVNLFRFSERLSAPAKGAGLIDPTHNFRRNVPFLLVVCINPRLKTRNVECTYARNVELYVLCKDFE